MARTHACPGCGTLTPYHLLACGPCWRQLPPELRRKVNVTYQRRQVDPRGHVDAITEAKAWYRQRTGEA